MFGCFADGLQDPTVVVFPDESVSPEGPRASELPCLAERFRKRWGISRNLWAHLLKPKYLNMGDIYEPTHWIFLWAQVHHLFIVCFLKNRGSGFSNWYCSWLEHRFFGKPWIITLLLHVFHGDAKKTHQLLKESGYLRLGMVLYPGISNEIWFFCSFNSNISIYDSK